jgi:diguanylate cyclase (GGDEF)-like protein/hemerythrin-like metal-binding protein/PAS domain S-box-containing protein
MEQDLPPADGPQGDDRAPAENERLLAALLESSSAVIGIKDPDGLYLFVNREYEKLLAQPRAKILGRSDRDLLPPEIADAVRQHDAAVVSSGRKLAVEEQFLVSGEQRSYLAVKFPVRLDAGRTLGVGVVAVDITERKQNEVRLESALKTAEELNATLHDTLQELERLARTDRLTGAWNRRRLEEAARNEMHRMHRYGHPVSVLIMDLDRFKQVNDRFGHPAGDGVLIEVADITRQTLRESDSLTRWGGEEFVVLAPSTTLGGAIVLAEKLRARIGGHGFRCAHRVTASFGVAEYQSAETYDDWIGRADQALYAAKRAGRNRVEADPATAFRHGAGPHVEGHLVQLAWRGAYACGHPTIDQQHQGLFQTANDLLGAVLSGQPREEVSELVERLIADVAGHFRDEEEIMRECGYPGADAHAGIHAELTHKARGLAGAFAAGTLSVGDLFQYLAYDVVALHMLGEDRAYLPYVVRAAADSG